MHISKSDVLSGIYCAYCHCSYCHCSYLICFFSKTYIWSTVGFTLMSFVTGAMAWWAPIFVGYSQSVYYNKEITENDKYAYEL